MTLQNKVALITGASSGIGLEVAKLCIAQGARVALVARTESKLRALAEELGGESRAQVFPLDVTDRQAVVALPGRVQAAFGRLDYVVNNAGVHHRGPLRALDAEQLGQMVDANLLGPILLTHAALACMQSGVIVNVASLAGKVPVPNAATYSSTKFGLRTFGRALDLELQDAGSGVRIATVSPGPVDTGFFGEDLDRVADITFSQPMSTGLEVAEAVLAAMRQGEVGEIDVPGPSGALATLGYLSPRLYAGLRPLMSRLGARNKRKYQNELARRAK